MKTKTLVDYLKEPYGRLLIRDDDGSYSAEIVEFPGCFSQGETADEAIKNLDEAAKNWIEEMLKQGKPIPEPMANCDVSGKFALRLPRGLHQKASQLAEREGVSLNTFFVDAIAEIVGGYKLYDRLAQRAERRLENLAVANLYALRLPELQPIKQTSSTSKSNLAGTHSFKFSQDITIEVEG